MFPIGVIEGLISKGRDLSIRTHQRRSHHSMHSEHVVGGVCDHQQCSQHVYIGRTMGCKLHPDDVTATVVLDM